jgi:hypothetical protein
MERTALFDLIKTLIELKKKYYLMILGNSSIISKTKDL